MAKGKAKSKASQRTLQAANFCPMLPKTSLAIGLESRSRRSESTGINVQQPTKRSVSCAPLCSSCQFTIMELGSKDQCYLVKEMGVDSKGSLEPGVASRLKRTSWSATFSSSARVAKPRCMKMTLAWWMCRRRDRRRRQSRPKSKPGPHGAVRWRGIPLRGLKIPE